MAGVYVADARDDSVRPRNVCRCRQTLRYHACMGILGHGVDIVEIARIDQMLREHGERFIERCFTDAERAYADDGGTRRAERYAARFAAKEAALKALGTGWRSGIGWRDVGVVRTPEGGPELVIAGRFAEIARERGITRWHVSLSHAGQYAIASVIGCAEES